MLDRSQQATLSAAQIAASSSLADKQIAANTALQTAQQTYTTNQNALDRTQQKAIADLQVQASKDNVGTTFGLNTASTALNSINAIAADGNLDAAAKSAAVQNVIDASNATLKWGAAFYNVKVPTLDLKTTTGGGTTTTTGGGTTTTTGGGSTVNKNVEVA